MQNKLTKIPYKGLRHTLATPFILGMSIPIVILDLTMEIYHHVAFPLYGIPIVKRSNYIRIDRQKLSYLSFGDKIWCMYCGYANGVMAYGVKLAGETEKYWCGIKHKAGGGFIEPAHHKDFLPYGDKKAYEEKYGCDKSHPPKN
jgi:hypothetical protein